MQLKKGNTIYTLEKGIENRKDKWVLFSRTVYNTKTGVYSINEHFSINLMTNEVHCNRTGHETFGIKRYIKLCVRIEKLFNVSSLWDL